jgi:hypothetical protein
MSDFAMSPDRGPPRLFRFVDGDVLPAGTIAHLDKENNVLTIDKLAYEMLTLVQQSALLRTHAILTETVDDYLIG